MKITAKSRGRRAPAAAHHGSASGLQRSTHPSLFYFSVQWFLLVDVARRSPNSVAMRDQHLFISYDAGSICLRYATHFGCIRGCFEGGSMLGECISPLHDHRAVSDGCSCTVEIRPMHEDVVVSPTSRLVNFPSSVCIGGCSLHNPPCIIDCMHGGLST